MTAAATENLAGVGALAGLAREVVDLKRMRDARSPRSLAEWLFARSWTRLVRGDALGAVALGETAQALAAVRLAGIDRAVMRDHGLTDAEAAAALVQAFDDVAGPLDGALRDRLREALAQDPARVVPLGDEPGFVEVLVRQPRAGATHPGVPRLVLDPAESHADHCASVALLSVLLAPTFGADPARSFLTGLAHHLFNVTLPDAGFAGDQLLGDAADRMTAAAFERALVALPGDLREETKAALAATREAQFDTPAARTFHAADVLDRVLEMERHARSARFRLADALGTDTEAGQRNIVHAGFEQDFQREVLHAAGLWPPEGLR
ncbi:MAG: hypothetical protein AAGI91_09505 [Bacteroidota bacterium]